MRKSVRRLVCLMVALLILAACGAGGSSAPAPRPVSGPDDPVAEQPAPPVVTTDREGHPITLPEQINTIISIGPSNTEVLVALGFGDNIIATDIFSEDIEGIQPGISQFELLSIDVEQLIDLQPDIIFVTGMTRVGGYDDPLSMVTQAGITVIYMPSSASIADIKEDIRFMAAVVDAAPVGEAIIAEMQTEIDRIRQIGQTVAERRAVYFEISPAPHMVSFGTQTFLHEMIEVVGAENIFADRDEAWFSIADEVLLAANPDVILTSVNFIDDPIGEIMDRPGWGAITAVQNGAVFPISTDASNRPSHNIVIALREMAQAIYPDYFG